MELPEGISQVFTEKLLDTIGSRVVYLRAEGDVSDNVLHLLEGVAPN